MHKLAAALTVTLNVLLAASPAAGARAAPPHTLARRQAVFARGRCSRPFPVSQDSSLLEKQNTWRCKNRTVRRLSDHTRMAHLDTMQF